MTNKLLGIIAGVQVVTLFLVGVLFFSPAKVIERTSLGAEGDTNYTNVVASGYITAGSYLTVTGTSTNSGNNFSGGYVSVDADGSFPNVSTATTTPNMVFPTVGQVCANPIVNVSGIAAATSTVQLPSSTVWSGSCFSTGLGTYNFSVFNGTTGTLTFGSGGSSTIGLFYTASTTNTFVAQSSTMPARSFADFTVRRYPSGTDGTWTAYGYVIRF